MAPVVKSKPKKITKKLDVVPEDSVVSGQLDKKIKKQQKKIKDKRGVVFIKHLPHGFFEEQLKNYFQQFGDVTRLRLVRSRRTGGSKGFAFIEFEYPEIAQVAAETMDNYLMFKRVVKASYIPPEQQKFNYFKTSVRKVTNKAGKEIYVSSKTNAIQRKVNEQNNWSDEAYYKRTVKKMKKVKELNKKYAQLGIDFNSVVVKPEKKKLVDDAQKTAADNVKKTKSSKKQKAITNKTLTEVVATAQNNKKKQKKITKDDTVNLEDLLGNTLNDDSNDEDYIAIEPVEDEEQDDDEPTSDEETYGFSKDSEEESTDNEDEEQKLVGKAAVPSKSYQKSAKPTKVDRFDKLIKRKPHVGGIQKTNKKNHQQKSVAKKSTKTTQLIRAAKEIAKTSSGLKHKTAKAKQKRTM